MLEFNLKANHYFLETALDLFLDAGDELYKIEAVKLPLRLQVHSKDELADTRIYVWELTPRSKNQYEIQMTGIDYFEPRSGKTLILGWWKKTNIFVGFDARKHLGKSRSSPYIQIQGNALQQAHINGFEACYKGKNEVAIVFHSDFFNEYLNNLEPLHDFGQSLKDLSLLREIIRNPEISETGIHIRNFARKMTAISLYKKLREVSFKNRVLTSYGFRCAFCNSFDRVEAVHIIPFNHEMSSDETRNGLALCALHHKAYDQALVTVDTDYSIQINRFQVGELQTHKLREGFADFSQRLRRWIIVPPTSFDRPPVEYIRIANNIRGWK